MQRSETGGACVATWWVNQGGSARSSKSAGAGGEPPYLVRFDDGHTSLVFPGPDAVIEHSSKKGKKRPPDG
jgi:Domain of unknown function (DUF1918)